jgi:hypothetical protein
VRIVTFHNEWTFAKSEIIVGLTLKKERYDNCTRSSNFSHNPESFFLEDVNRLPTNDISSFSR